VESFLNNSTGGPSGCALWRVGARWTPDILLRGEAWRLAVPICMHAGFIHLAMNIFAQLTIGLQAEFKWGMETRVNTMDTNMTETPVNTETGQGDSCSNAAAACGSFSRTPQGTCKVFVIYMVSGIMGNVLASVAETDLVLGVGASGSILGMVGGELAFLWSTWSRWEPHQRFERTRGMLISLVLVFVVGIAAPINTDNWAHLGGLLSGFSLGLFAHHRNFERSRGRLVAVILSFLGIVGSIVLVVVLFSHTKDKLILSLEENIHRPTMCVLCKSSDLSDKETQKCASSKS